MKLGIHVLITLFLVLSANALSDADFGFQQAFTLKDHKDVEYILDSEDLTTLIFYFKRGDSVSQQIARNLAKVGEEFDTLANFVLFDCTKGVSEYCEDAPRFRYAVPPRQRLNFEKKEINKHQVEEYDLSKGSSVEDLSSLLKEKMPFQGLEIDNDSAETHLKCLFN